MEPNACFVRIETEMRKKRGDGKMLGKEKGLELALNAWGAWQEQRTRFSIRRGTKREEKRRINHRAGPFARSRETCCSKFVKEERVGEGGHKSKRNGRGRETGDLFRKRLQVGWGSLRQGRQRYEIELYGRSCPCKYCM